ncbi:MULTISPECIES: ABC transporter ATP-binding protein [Butyricimonas]|uniref:ABC transporter ATP-binding protein n=1 Tax=Butyricimonas hominis TaxID=2763032 RepID=A0ABR7D272_9BACT|nr:MULTISPECIES: ABC transporter ATP-binding protein [Butyricimonas]MBC5622029.1 ABC transporter ATP-binding protein [Butyricimonas hominis]MCB6974737.1 ABC transporter ATP-binding protein [Butyricimonas synergistica]MCG4521479.1 ABC transporter ATP-binding protein [Butyricimonas sp. DFI.6.44]
MEEAIVKVEHLSHRYSVQWAVKDISFEIPKRGIYGLLGSNGAGKSTVMNIICGVLKQTEGNVLIHGADTRLEPLEAKKHIGFLPQQAPLYTDMTVEEYLTHSAYLRRMPDKEIKSAVEEVMERCSIMHFRSRLIKNLSGGYQQRVGIAQAIVHKPALVVFDEPTNGLDPNQILDIRRLIQDIAKERTVILSTHILREVHAICDYLLMIEQGKLVFSGTVDQFDNYIVPSTIFLQLADAPAPEVLMQVEGVTGVEELGGQRFRISFEEAEGVLERLIEASSRNRWRLMEIRPEKSSLDDIFAALSKQAH